MSQPNMIFRGVFERDIDELKKNRASRDWEEQERQAPYTDCAEPESHNF